MKSTITDRVQRFFGHDEFKRDEAKLESTRKDVGQRLQRAAQRMKKDGDEHKINLSAREKIILEGAREDWAKIAKSDATVDAYFPYAALFSDRVAQLREDTISTALTDKGAKLVLEDLKREVAKQDMLDPMRMGDDVEERAKKHVKTVLAMHNLSDDTDPETIIAVDLYSRIDPFSASADELVKDAIADAEQLLREAREREEFELLTYAVRETTNRERANVTQAEEKRRRLAINPGARGTGFFEGIGAAIARGMAGSSAKVPDRNAKKKTGFRQILDDAAEGV